MVRSEFTNEIECRQKLPKKMGFRLLEDRKSDVVSVNNLSLEINIHEFSLVFNHGPAFEWGEKVFF